MVKMTQKLSQYLSPPEDWVEKRDGRKESGNIPISFEELKNKYVFLTKWINSWILLYEY